MGAYNFALGAGAAAGAGIATVATVLGHGYSAAIVTCAVAPLLTLPLVLLSKKRAGNESEKEATVEKAPAAAS
jgi:cyanate permease